MNRTGNVALSLIAVCSLVGCRVGPNYKRPVIDVPSHYTAALAPESSEATAASIATLEWASIFRDPALSELINAGLRENLDLTSAAARVLEAQAYLGQVRASQYPYVAGGASYVALHLPEKLASALNDQQFLRGGGPTASASWSLDFWGLYRRQTEAARAEMLASVWAQRAVQITTIESIAEAYFNLRSLDEQIQITEKTIETRTASTKLASALEKGGYSSAEDLRQAEESLHEAEANLPTLREAAAVQEHVINLLTAQPPSGIRRGLSIADQPRPDAVPAGLPSDLLERRPDIRQAEETLIAANARIGVARAKYFPNISLTALGGASNNQLNQVLTSGAGYWGVSGGIAEPIFDAGRIRSENRFAKAQDAEMEATYRKTILDAFRQTSDALVSYRETHTRRLALEQQVYSASEALRLANMRYEGGNTAYLEVLTVQTDLYNAQLALTRSREREASSLAQLYAALGGGWR